MKGKSDKIVLKIFGGNNEEKRAHNCYLCQIYKREASRGDIEALNFYKSHLNSIVKKYGGATIVLSVRKRVTALPRQMKAKA